MYTDFYQFSEKPFEDNPDPKFLYWTPSYQEILVSILTWIKEGHGFAAITGEAGIGKTFFIHTLVSHLDEKINSILILNPVITFRDLLKQILSILKQPTPEDTKRALFHRFIEYLNQMMVQGKTLVIILDEAQGMSDRALEEIESFFDLRSKPIRILFVGQPHFDERLNSMDLRRLGQKIKTKLKIKPFTEKESRGYIDHRLRLVGSSTEIMTFKAISMICSYTQGIPSLINHVCDNALRVGCTMNRKKIDVDIIEKVIQNFEGPRMTPRVFPSIQLIRHIWKSLIQFAVSFKRVPMAILLLVCLGGSIYLLYEHIGHGSMKIQEIKSFIREKNSLKPSTHEPSAQGTIEGILEKERIPISDEPKPTLSDSLSVPQDAILLTSGKGKQRLPEVIVVKSGENLSLLSRNYYHIANPTLIDFILQSNPEITNADLIKIDQKIKIPKMTEESLVNQSPDHSFKIHVGTFWSSEFSKVYHDEPALKNKTIEIIPLKVSPTEIWYRVFVGDFKDRDEALNTIYLLKKKGLLPNLPISPSFSTSSRLPGHF
jgi:general secretion pathway protein A